MTGKKTFLICLLIIGAVSFSFAQPKPKIIGKFEDIGTNWSDFAKHNAGRLNITGDLGGNWSDAYIGELINFPPHYGFGITLALNGIRSEQLNNLLVDTLGIDKINPLFTEKIFFPTYTIEMRIGGPRGWPFDIGIKIGMWPDMLPMPLFSDFKFSNLHLGADLRWNLVQSYTGWKCSIGLGFNMVNGYLHKDGYTQKWSEDGNGSGQPVINPKDDSSLRIFWDSITPNARVVIQRSFRGAGFTLFGGIVAGFGITNTGLSLIGENFTYGGKLVANMSGAELLGVENDLSNYIGNGSKWTSADTNGSFTLKGTMSANAFDLHSKQGISFDFDNDLHLQIELTLDLMNLEYGMAFGFRWQQKQL